MEATTTYTTLLKSPTPNLQFCPSANPLPLYPKTHCRKLLDHQKGSNLYRKPTRRITFWTRPLVGFNTSVVIKASSSSMESSTTTTTDTTKKQPFRVLFVCLGNICRSPAAEAVFRDVVKKRGLESEFFIDSAGTINYHEGNPADPRMRAASKKRGVEVTSISRPIQPSDFVNFDIILAMDKQNKEDILEAFNRWKFREPLPDDAAKKVKLMCSFCKKHNETEVPDPYYGGPQGFEMVLDLLEDACESLLDSILAGEQ